MTRWKEAFEPPSTATDDEKIYETWGELNHIDDRQVSSLS